MMNVRDVTSLLLCHVNLMPNYKEMSTRASLFDSTIKSQHIFFFFKSHRSSSKLDWLTLQFSYEQNMASECLCQSSSAKWSILNWEWFINVFDNSLNAMSNTKVVIHNSAKYTLSLMIQFTTKYLEFLIKWFWWLIFNNWTF